MVRSSFRGNVKTIHIVKMRELKRDMEAAICGRQISSEGGAGTARTSAGMEAWIGDATASAGGPSHVVLASTASGYTTPPVTSGHPTTASTVGTTPTLFAFTSTSLHYALQQVWEQGGDARVILCDAGRKRAIDAFTSIATRFVDVSQGAQASITGAANIYVSDFGKHQVILNRYGGNGATADGLTVSTVLCIDPSYRRRDRGGRVDPQRLVPRLVASAPARIVTVASGRHFKGTIDFDDLGFERGYQILRAYARSKLANVLFASEQARRLAGSGITSNSLHPGRVATNIWSGAPRWAQPLIRFGLSRTFITVEEGAQPIIALASRPDLSEVTGQYFDRLDPITPSPLAEDARLAARLWEESERLTTRAFSP